jgi:hypothetical protein
MLCLCSCMSSSERHIGLGDDGINIVDQPPPVISNYISIELQGTADALSQHEIHQ